MNPITDLDAEWLETDGLGGFASGTVGGPRTRRYHALVVHALTPPTGRRALVTGFDAWVEPMEGHPGPSPEFLTVQRYAPDHQTRPIDHLVGFSGTPWPTWTYRLADGTEIEHELFIPHLSSQVVLRWRLRRPSRGKRLVVRPFLAGRDVHALHHENDAFRFESESSAGVVRWRPYPDCPAIVSRHNGRYHHAPTWYRRFQLDEERARGFDFLEDAGSPGFLSWDLSAGDAHWVLGAETPENEVDLAGEAAGAATRLRVRERQRRRRLGGPLARAGDQYLVRRGIGKTIVAGYPWFTDWGRDTFISLRGLCLATGRLEEARAILLEWAEAVSEGMLPNRFVDQGDQPEFNSVDASLWYVIVGGELMAAYRAAGKRLLASDRGRIEEAAQAILTGYHRGTRYQIHADADGLLAAGVPGVQLTWMDAKVGDWVVTPRIGKPVEVQALWHAALVVGGGWDERWQRAADRVRTSFAPRFWNAAEQCLYDVVDCDGADGRVDPSIRPNQILAVGGVPAWLLDGTMATAVVDTVERELWTPLGLRSLSPRDPAYQGRYRGGPRERDGAYHQGTVWPWLLGPFVEAWLRVRGITAGSREEGRARFLTLLLEHLARAGIGHVSEIADGDPPHRPGGCPFQAWSVGEAIRIERLLGEPVETPLASPNGLVAAR
jgi:predicted glycogen debranching enzyme